MMSVLQIYDVEQARRALLRRRPLAEVVLPPSVRERLAEVFGRQIGAVEAVAEILADVRARGDEALCDWTLRLDGVEIDNAAVPQEALRAAWDGLPDDLRQALNWNMIVAGASTAASRCIPG
jgi:histidinol dehydrogenase